MKKTITIVLCMLLLSSCAMPSGVEELLVAPRLNTRQAEMYEALESAINLSSIRYRYPQSGGYRSPFVFYDLDGDGTQEAMVFYAYNSHPNDTRITVFKEGATGGWAMVCDIPGSGNQVDFIQFASPLSGNSECMVIGWQDSRHTTKYLGVYSFTSDGYREEVMQSYTEYLIGVFSASGVDQILVSEEVSRNQFDLVLLGKGIGGRLQELDRFAIAQEADEVLQLLVGRLGDQSNEGAGIYVDELWNGGDIYTEILQINGNTLEPIATQSGGDDFTVTQREYLDEEEYVVLSADLDKDGVVEIPVLFGLPGQEESGELSRIMLTQLMRMESSGFVAEYAAINLNDGYAVDFPEKWVDAVTVVRQSENREWQFYAVDPDTEERTNELLRIRVHDTRGYKDKFIGDYKLLAESGLLEYYAYIPKTSDEPLAITAREAGELFLLL